MIRIHMIRTHLSKYDHTDKCSQICTYRTQRNIVCQEKQSEKYNCTDHKNPPVKSNHKSYRCSYALPALKIKIKRKIMPQNTPSCCIKAQQRQNISIRISEYCPYDQDGRNTLQTVTQQIQCPGIMANQKMKTKRAAAKRFKVTGTGKLVRNKAYKSHILTKKTTKRKRNLRKSTLVDETNVKTMKKIMPYA